MVLNLIRDAPPSVYYFSNFITETQEKLIIERVNSVPKPKWTQLSNRRLQNWGGIPHPKGMISEPIPGWLQDVIDKVSDLGVFEQNCTPNHVLINEYLPGQGIMPHFDGPLFYPKVVTISCGSHTVLKLNKPHVNKDLDPQMVPEEAKPFSLLLEPRSLLLLQDSMYHDYQHCIEEVDRDILDESVVNLELNSQNYHIGQVLDRSTRISLTIRHVPKTSKLKINLGR